MASLPPWSAHPTLLTSWQGPGRRTRGNSGSATAQCGPIRPGQMQIFDCGDIFDDGHRVWTECTGPRRNANSRMIQWYNAPCHLITCPFSRTGPSPRTWLAIQQLELRCLGLAHWDQKRRRRITSFFIKTIYSLLLFCIKSKGQNNGHIEVYVVWPMTLSAHGAGVMQSVMMVRWAACVSADPGLAWHHWPSAQSCSDSSPGHMWHYTLSGYTQWHRPGTASTPAGGHSEASRGCQRPETEAGLVTAAQMWGESLEWAAVSGDHTGNTGAHLGTGWHQDTRELNIYRQSAIRLAQWCER